MHTKRPSRASGPAYRSLSCSLQSLSSPSWASARAPARSASLRYQSTKLLPSSYLVPIGLHRTSLPRRQLERMRQQEAQVSAQLLGPKEDFKLSLPGYKAGTDERLTSEALRVRHCRSCCILLTLPPEKRGAREAAESVGRSAQDGGRGRRGSALGATLCRAAANGGRVQELQEGATAEINATVERTMARG